MPSFSFSLASFSLSSPRLSPLVVDPGPLLSPLPPSRVAVAVGVECSTLYEDGRVIPVARLLPRHPTWYPVGETLMNRRGHLTGVAMLRQGEDEEYHAYLLEPVIPTPRPGLWFRGSP